MHRFKPLLACLEKDQIEIRVRLIIKALKKSKHVDLKKKLNMKNKIKHFVGIDISKSTLDASMVVDGQVVFYRKIPNTAKAIKSLIKDLKHSHNISFQDTVFCAEHTGIYGNILVNYLVKAQAIIWFESGAHIKKTSGLTRGKSDQLDSKKIAEFAFTHIHKIKPYTPPRASIEQLKILCVERTRLIKIRQQLLTPIKEQEKFLAKKELTESKKRAKAITKTLEIQIKDLERQIHQVVQSDDQLNRNYKIISSVDGVGLVSALELLVTTENFEKIKDAKKYACYSGIAPFEHSSGTSVRGKNRVSHMANKKVKKVLHMAALSAIKMEGELRDFYLRKVDEGKNKMSIINAVRNKIIHRVFACIKNNRLYQKNYQYQLIYP